MATPEFHHQWPATYFESSFNKGREIYISFYDPPMNRYRVIIDGKTIALLDKPGTPTYKLTGLSNKAHTIRVEKINESQNNRGTFRGFFLKTGATALPLTKRARQIEFIGDSDMVGYANTSTKRECTKAEVFETTDSHKAYPAQVARTYNADFQLNAYSGIGIVRNYDGNEPDRPMPVLYPRVLFDDPTPYDRKGWAPQVIVIAIGGNDFSTPLKPGEKWKDLAALRADWETVYVNFLSDIRAQNPHTFILMGIQDGFNDDYFKASQSVLATYKATGDTRIGAVVYPKLESTACDWHPSLNDHKTMKTIVETFIDTHPDIWQGK
ncbi:SGNH/GDSL hydrolase family protein [Asticcacaulis machinosus]|uniref:GDSL-type esterase/lipase family protein n=1 Tax=Asticcacaulis machinosus TaxID=2984211 RepID=A0ABT5HJ50_9CAUL|nr:SGNH/GDSL hydrolase family protein [Asticcacaulis machinosus]MDC7676165.1 GDSL-type esterase/lipase family protein [Asticcacaulis machinosus]